ncbi:MAG: acyl-CoA thioesterase [Proteobacteria bacterium]|nr:acyl-CoA thioesterase [Pseudomonadota bacterium]
MYSNSIDITVEWGDCDPAGIVFYPNYFRWFNQGAHALFGAAGMPFHEMIEERDIAGVPMLDTQASFRAPIRFGEVITLTSRIGEWRSKSFTVAHKVHKGGQLCAEGRDIRAWVIHDDKAPNGIRAVTIPDDVKRRFEDGP